MKIERKFFKIRSREINNCYNFDELCINLLHRLQRLQNVQSWAGESEAGPGWWEDQLETTIARPRASQAKPDAFLGIFKSHTFSIYKIALTRHAELSCVVCEQTSLFCEIHYQLCGDTVDHVPNGIKGPKKIANVLKRKRITL